MLQNMLKNINCRVKTDIAKFSFHKLFVPGHYKILDLLAIGVAIEQTFVEVTRKKFMQPL
jgi:hypothetical protein